MGIGNLVKVAEGLFETFVPHPGSPVEAIAKDLGLPAAATHLLAAGADLLGQNYAAAAADLLELLPTHGAAPTDRGTPPPRPADPGAPPPSRGARDRLSASGAALPADSSGAGGLARARGLTDGAIAAVPSRTAAPGSSGSGSHPVPAAPSSSGATTKLLDLSDEDLVRAVENNQIPPEVRDDPAALLALQARINRYNEMITLLTTIQRTTHEMRLEIIRNVRA